MDNALHTTARPVSGPQVWRGPEMAKRRAEWERRLTPAEVAAMDAAVRRLDPTGLDIAAMTPGDFAVPELEPLIREMHDAVLKGRGFILVRGLPVDRWSPRQAGIAYFGLGAHLGEAMTQNRKGHVLGHVKDIGLDYNAPTNRGYQTAARLPYHTDSSDLVGLLCLKPAKAGGLSTIVSSGALYNAMLERAPDLLELLCQPVYRDRRGEVPAGADDWYAVPVFNRMPGGGLVTSYVRSAMRKAQRFPQVPRLTPELDAACDLLDSLADSDEFHLDMDFAPGDIQLLNNHWLMHSRTAFEDFPEVERRRHLFRLWLACPDGPELPDSFTSHWQGANAAGRPIGIKVPGVVPNAPLDAE